MEQPSKRRRLSKSSLRCCSSQVDCSRSSTTTITTADRSFAPYSHGVEECPHWFSSGNKPSRVEEVHIEIKREQTPYRAGRRAIEDAHHRLHRRQTSAGTAVSVSSGETVVVSVVATVDPSGSTVDATTLPVVPSEPAFPTSLTVPDVPTATDVVPTVPTVPSFPFTSTTTLISSDNTSADTPQSSSTAAATTDASTEPSTTRSSTAVSTSSSSSVLPEGMIGLNPIGGSTTTSSMLSSLASNRTMTSSGSSSVASATLTGPAYSSTGSILPSVSSSVLSAERNFTTSAIVISNSHTTYTSFSTIDLGPLSTRTSTAGVSASRIDTYLYETILTTLSNGVVSTRTQSTSAEITTLPDGSVSTIPASDFSTAAPTDSSDSGSAATSDVAASTSGASAFPTTSGLDVTTTTGAGGVSVGSGTPTGSGSSATSSAAGGNNNNNNDDDDGTPPTPVLAGGIVGGVAGLAILLLTAMLFLRWYRRRASRMHQITEMEADPAGHSSGPVSRGPGMAERAGLRPLAIAAGSILPFKLRHTAPTEAPPATGERGFQRISGRKLPSAFSPGMMSTGAGAGAAPTMSPDHDRSYSNTSFYRDSTGWYGGMGGTGGSANSEDAAAETPMEIHPGPQRTPTVHPGGPYGFGGSPTPPPLSPRSMLHAEGARSRTATPSTPLASSFAGTGGGRDTPATFSSFGESRGSRFTEEV